MKIRNSKILSITALLALAGTVGCTSHYERLNTNPNEVTADEKKRDDYNIAAALTNMQNTVISTDVNTCQFTEMLLGGPLGGYFADSNSGWGTKISTYNAPNNWMKPMFDDIIPEFYSNYNDLQDLTDDIVPLAIARVMKVATMHRVTDTYGPIPYSQIGEDGQIQVPYDSQQDIYNQFFEELNLSIEELTERRTESLTAAADFIYSGDVEKWIKYANSLKLRLAMRIVYANESLARQMASEAVNHEVGVMESNDDNAAFNGFGEKGNPIYVAANYNNADPDTGAASNTGGDHHTSADITSYMNGYEDPRRSAYFLNSEFTGYEYVGLRSGIDIPSSSVVFKYAGINVTNTSPLYWMNAAEVQFLKAEAALCGWTEMGGTAQEFYEQGIRLSFAQWSASGVDAYLADDTSTPGGYVDPEGLYGYGTAMSSVTIAWSDAAAFEENLEKIIVQKWIANWTLGNEAWADRRRTGYPRLFPVAVNFSGGVLQDGDIPRRLPYTANEYSTNTANVTYAVTSLLQGTDNMATRLWWDKNPNSN